MITYYDKYGRLHDKPCKDGEPSSNNGFIYSAYAKKLGLEINIPPEFCTICAIDYVRHPRYVKQDQVPMSRDEILGLAYLGYISDKLVNGGWSFSPFPLPRLNPLKLLSQLWQLRPIYGRVDGVSERLPRRELIWKHRNYFWENNLDQVYHIAFSVPVTDRAFILECWGETKSLRYFFYKTIAWVDSKLPKENGIRWLKYGKSLEGMQKEFPEDHPLNKYTSKSMADLFARLDKKFPSNKR